MFKASVTLLCFSLIPAISSLAAREGNWCTDLQDMGKIHSDPSNPYIQSLNLEGRMHYQMMHISGNDAKGNDFNDSADNYRRVRIGIKSDFLQYFKIKADADLVNDDRFRRGGLNWGYQQSDTAVLSFNAQKALSIDSLDTLSISLGRHKLDMTAEGVESSNHIITLERSALANKVSANARPTGLAIQAGRNDWIFSSAIFSTEADSDFIDAGFNDGMSYFAAADYKVSDHLKLRLDAVYNHLKAGDDNRIGYQSATSLNAVYQNGAVGFLGTMALGDNGNQGANRSGSFHGITLMPWYWMVEKKLQAVFQYSYSGSSQSEGIRANSRYLTGEDNPPGVDLNDGRGDRLHTIYTGLNYYVCENNLKLMGGIECSELNTPAGKTDAFTYLLGIRLKF